MMVEPEEKPLSDPQKHTASETQEQTAPELHEGDQVEVQNNAVSESSFWSSAKKTIFGSVSPWIGLVSGLVAVIAIAWTTLNFFTAAGEFDLVVWIQENTLVYPSSSTDDISLPLSYGGDLTESATIVKVNITNFGSRFIGSQNELWQLDLIADSSDAKILLLGEPSPNPKRTIVVVPPTSNSDIVSLEIGVLEPGAQIDLQLLVIDAKNPNRPDLDATTNLAGLPRPLVTGQSLHGRLTEKFFLPVTFVLIILLSYGSWTILRENWSNLIEEPLILPSPVRVTGAILVRVIFVLVVSIFWAALISVALGWLASLTVYSLDWLVSS